MPILPTRFSRVARAALLLAAAGCTAGTAPEFGGEYIGSLDSPFSVEGAALIEISHPDIRSVSAPGRILVARGVTERTVRLLIVNPPRNQAGGPISFVVRMGGDARPPRAEVLAVAGPLNEDRAFPEAFSVRFTRYDGDHGGGVVDPGPGGYGRVPFVRLVAPFFPGGAALYRDEQSYVDERGNHNQIFDLGDVRGYLYLFGREIPPAGDWTR